MRQTQVNLGSEKMPFDIFTYSNATTPNRLYAMLRLIQRSHAIGRGIVLELMQPSSLVDGRTISIDVFRIANLLGLIELSETKDKEATLAIKPEALANIENFRNLLQSRVTGITSDSDDHFLLNEVASWIAVQDNWILTSSKSDWEKSFNSQLYPGREERMVNEHPDLTQWLEWAEFIGWGWQAKIGKAGVDFVPDCTLRLLPLLPDLLPDTDFIPFSPFMERLSARCPELDGGALFERCWEACRPQERRGNRLSLMLSTALRVLNQRGVITLENRADSTENWTLFPAQSYIARVTHIHRGTSQ
jgi:hypothetical protein